LVQTISNHNFQSRLLLPALQNNCVGTAISSTGNFIDRKFHRPSFCFAAMSQQDFLIQLLIVRRAGRPDEFAIKSPQMYPNPFYVKIVIGKKEQINFGPLLSFSKVWPK
jgi:hypothetical protein